MKFLIDTNIFIPLEPTLASDVEPGTARALDLARLAAEASHQLCVHPTALTDIRRDKNKARRALREKLLEKYPALPDPPALSRQSENALGPVRANSNDWVDHQLLAALEADAVDCVVTNDLTIRRKAERLGLHNRVMTVGEAIAVIEVLLDKVPSAPPHVDPIVAHALDQDDPIFQTLREDYPDFDQWFTKVKRQHRRGWCIRGSDPYLAAVCLVKQEESGEFGFSGKVLKISPFKVSEGYRGLRFGELLLKAVFNYGYSNAYDTLYVTVFDKYGRLIDLLKDFGFRSAGSRTSRGELVLEKPMSFSADERESLEPLDFNVRYGPFAVKVKEVPAFIVPIQPQYHRLLFPEAQTQLDLMAGQHPFGNSIRKAYLSHAAIRTIPCGANLLFYRSTDSRSVKCLGVVEETYVSSCSNKIARYVGTRTVYGLAQIEELCQKEVLAILFRQSRILKNPIPLHELIGNHLLLAPPQSIVKVDEEASKWLENRIAG